MARIESYVFLDLETTSLPSLEHNKTRITELCMVVVKRKHLLDTKVGVLPRVQHKLTMCFNPGRMISPEATDTSGLENELLKHETMFNKKVFNAINSFLDCQVKPVCLISENGFGFDFPILKNHFMKLDVSLNEDVMCADSLYAFYDIFKEKLSNVDVLDGCNKLIGNPTSDETPPLQGDTAINNNIPTELSSVYCKDNHEEVPPSSTKIETTDELLIKDKDDEEVNTQLSMQSQNDRTPSAKKIKITPVKPLKGVKRKIFFEGDPKPKESFKLTKIYERVLGSPLVGHRAENDCIMTAELSTVKVDEFVKWIDNNHCAFSEIKPMRVGVRVGD